MKLLCCLLAALLIICVEADSQTTKKALFIGNSYIYVNDLPGLLADCAASTGDSIYSESSTPGGYTLEQHTSNPTTLSKIAAGDWNYVVLQEQSQMPAFPIDMVVANTFPYASILDSIINAENECAETVFFMTWGRRDGDADNCGWWPVVCTYEGMDSLLQERYTMMAENNHAIVSPVAATWFYLRSHYPAMELYNADGSHPSLYGSYAAACTFYTALFKKDPSLISFDAGLPPTDAENIRNAAKLVVYDSLSNWFIDAYDVNAEFTIDEIDLMEYQFNNYSVNAESYMWDFGDGNTSGVENPTHIFAAPGYYNITLTAVTECDQDVTTATLFTGETAVTEPNATEQITISLNLQDQTLHILTGSEMTCEMILSDVNGRIILQTELTQQENKIMLHELPAGIYLVAVIKDHTITASAPIIIQND